MSILLKIMSPETYARIKNSYENPPSDLDDEQIEDQKKFVNEVASKLKVERPPEDHTTFTEQDYEDIAILATANAFNMPMIERLDDLNFCDNCGKCCIETDIILLFDNEYKNLRRIMRDIDSKVSPHPFLSGQYTINSEPCAFYNSEEKKCKIYNRRPSVCKKYPISDQNIGGRIIRSLVTLSECNYSVKLISMIAIETFDKCLSS